MQSYTQFRIMFEVFKKERLKGNTESEGSAPESFIKNITKGLNESKVFEMNDEIKKLLLLTNPPNLNEDVMLPFEYLYLDSAFTKKELAEVGINIKYNEVVGVLISKGNLLSTISEEKVGTALRITTCSLVDTKEGERIWFDTFNTNVNITDEEAKNGRIHKETIGDKKVKKFVNAYVINFLNLVHSKDIKLIEVIRSNKNRARRIKNNKLPLPSSTRVTLTGELLIYMNKLFSSGHINYSHKFWVRGHWRTLRDEERYKEKAGTKVWIYPYIKGQGVLVNKTYKVIKNEKD